MNKFTQLLKVAEVYQKAAMLLGNWDSLNFPSPHVTILDDGIEVQIRVALVMQNPYISMLRNPEIIITLDIDDGIAYAYVGFERNIFIPGKEDWQDPCKIPTDIKDYLKSCGYFIEVN